MSRTWLWDYWERESLKKEGKVRSPGWILIQVLPGRGDEDTHAEGRPRGDTGSGRHLHTQDGGLGDTCPARPWAQPCEPASMKLVPTSEPFHYVP